MSVPSLGRLSVTRFEAPLACGCPSPASTSRIAGVHDSLQALLCVSATPLKKQCSYLHFLMALLKNPWQLFLVTNYHID